MLLVSVAIFAVLIIAAVAYINQQNISQHRSSRLSGHNQQQLPTKARNIFDLQIGDIVQYLDTDWVVEGKLTYTVSAYYWYEYLLQDDERIAWLSVEEDDKVEVSFLESTNQLEIQKIDFHHPPKKINFADETYQYSDSGIARMTRIGSTLRRKAEKCQYFDYEGSDDKVLSLEVWDGDIEVSIGYKISPRSLTILPGDGKTVYRELN